MERLCDAADIMAHPFFKSVNWSRLIDRKLDLPFKPMYDAHMDSDVSNYDEKFTESDPSWFASEKIRRYYAMYSAAQQPGGKPFVRYSDVFADPEMAWNYPY